MSFLTDAYRMLPRFKGKKRMGMFLFPQTLAQSSHTIIRCRNGLKFNIVNTRDSVGRDLFFDGSYEPLTTRTILKILSDGDVMVDAGANIGAISIPIGKMSNARIFSFEPGLNNFATLQQNIALNNVHNVFPFNLALSQMPGVVDFYESDRIHGGSGMVKIDGFKHYTVPATSLDVFCEENGINKIKVLKVDVQGWEYFLLRGTENLIKRKKVEHIIFEFESWAETNAGLKAGTAQQFLLEHGYQLHTLGGHRINSSLKKGTFMMHATR